MDTSSKIIALLKKKGVLTGHKLCQYLNISRQALNRHIQALLHRKLIQKRGSTRGALYYFSSLPPLIHKKFALKNLNEDRVFDELWELEGPLKIKRNIFDILYYAFTEMLNNAIDHSQGKRVSISVYRSPDQIAFGIEDNGIGVFQKIKKAKKLKDHFEACEEILKGKCTTDSLHHTGEGIFFTSKAVDLFLLESSSLTLEINNFIKDFSIKKSDTSKGTRVYVELNLKASRQLNQIFQHYTTKDFKFSKTHIYVKLFEKGDSFISRSEAKRLLSGLDKFETITLDFEKVKMIGQGFSDEIFRIFKHRYPKINIKVIHASKEVFFMIRRAS